eukprot:TRINITY_DN12742_c0_g2_i1.p2 TRINITY_DN12742_c0_g2~~TRINITY_DN12742_c0_g2_i1.p2  ORF type:complete len:106 (-),score=4.10 TRINITY_DN12742_c0_g2_i1:143-460(-)
MAATVARIPATAAAAPGRHSVKGSGGETLESTAKGLVHSRTTEILALGRGVYGNDMVARRRPESEVHCEGTGEHLRHAVRLVTVAMRAAAARGVRRMLAESLDRK